MKKALGRKAESESKMEVIMVMLKDLVVGENIRKKVPPARVDAMAASISRKMKDGSRYGIKDPLSVEKKNGKWVIHDGQVRFLGAQKAKYEPVPCLPMSVDDVRLFQLGTFLRSDPGPIEEAEAYQEQMKHMSMDQLVLATGKPEKDIRRRLMLLTLDKEMRAAIAEGKISAGHGVVLAQVGDIKQRTNLFKDTVRQRWPVAGLMRNLCNRNTTVELEMAVFEQGKCKNCQFCSIDSPELFDGGAAQELKGHCLNPNCFVVKQKEALKALIAAHAKEGVKAFAVNAWNDYSINGKDIPKELQADNIMAFSEYGHTPKKCENCQKRMLLYFLSGKPKQFCPDQACYRKETRSSTGGGGSGHDHMQARIDNRVTNTRARFLHATAAQHLNTHAALALAAAAMTGRKREDVVIERLVAWKFIEQPKPKRHSWESYDCLNNLPAVMLRLSVDQLHELILALGRVAVQEEHGMRQRELLDVIKFVGHDLSEFRVDAKYLRAMTKAQLTALGKEFGLTLPAKVDKVGDLVKFILDAKPDKAPAEITDTKKHPLS